MKIFFLGALLGALTLTACNSHKSEAPFIIKELPKPTLEPEEAPKAASQPEEKLTGVDRGRQIWLGTCVQCHNKDPNVKGSVGPETVDAPEAVVYAKVMTGRYPDPLPAGFVPKRTTKNMRPLPQYEKDIPDIYAYLQSVKKSL
jgi:mono/diheme cytochrome c family protein